jgi:uncharacterized protein (TIGR00255 family)
MIKSMTGYGRREGPWSGGTVTAEARSVNHRFCEIVVRVPRGLGSLEDPLKRIVQHTCARGRIELTVSMSGGREVPKTLTLDRALAKQYHRVLRDLKRELKLTGAVDVSLLANFRDIIVASEQPVDEAALAKTVTRLAEHAVGDLERMRRTEGTALARDVHERLTTVRNAVTAVRDRAPDVAREAFDRMRARVEKLLGAEAPDPSRLNQELATFADRYDIAEELTRLGSHLGQFEAALKSSDPIGRTLDFLLQEIGREVNTIGSKANDVSIAAQVVRLKSELEKIREQVQNIE